MPKPLGILLTLAIVFSAGSSKAQSEPPTPDTSSLNLFHELMNDPTIRAIFYEAQVGALNTPADQVLLQAFATEPTLKPFFEEIVNAHTGLLDTYSKEFALSGLRITEDFLKGQNVTVQSEKLRFYKELDNLIISTAKELGFPAAAIKNREIYILQGDVNAFTVSGNEQRIIVGVQSGLLEKMKPKEIEAVLGHELGHILSQHSLTRMTLGLFLEALGNQMTDAATRPPGLRESLALADPHALQNKVGSVQSAASKKRLDVFVAMASELAKVFESDRELREKILHGFLQTLVKGLVAGNGDPESIRFFAELASVLPKKTNFKVSGQEFLRHATTAMNFVSRAGELSSDRYAGSILPNEIIASAFLRLMGTDFGLQDRKTLIQEVKKQARQTIADLNPVQLQTLLDSTHPPIILRINWIMEIEKYPTLVFANRFLRLIMLYENIAIRLNLLKQSLKDPKTAPLRDALLKFRARLEKTEGRLSAHILGQIAGRSPEALRNPQLENFMAYYLLMKQMNLQWEKELKVLDPKAPERGVYEQFQLSTRVKTAELEKLLQKARVELTSISSTHPQHLARLQDMEVALGAESLEDVITLRQFFLTRYRGAKAGRQLPLHPLPELFKSSSPQSCKGLFTPPPT